ncbi:MAG: hypothetical protein M1834_008879 [Cirrosporium novae-zelandiae]|nr:MAG: hypothetical protein M1834_008879 [Cirrosporium novae-zelandiae]
MSDKDASTPRVFLARHGETEWTINGRYTGITELPLTPNGAQQVLGTGKVVVGPSKLIDPSKLAHIFISPRRRAQETFLLLFGDESQKALSSEGKVTTTEKLAEWDYGLYEGKMTREIRAMRKEHGLDAERPWDIWRDGCEEGESAAEVTARLDSLIEEIHAFQAANMHGERSCDVVLVAHGHLLRAFVKRWLKYPMEFPLSMMLPPGGIGMLRNASFEPGGWLDEPTLSSTPLLDLRIRPRMNLYTSDDNFASFIIDASISYTNGDPYYSTIYDKENKVTKAFTKLFIDISVADTGLDLVSNVNVTVNTTANEFQFSLANLPAQYEPYNITVIGASQDGNQSYIAETQLYRLPTRSDGGSITKIDSLYGGLMVQDYTTNSTEWSYLLPYSYYVSWDGWLSLNLSNVEYFKSKGYNIIHIVPNAGLANEAFNFTVLNEFLDRCDEVGLWVMYDMRWTYQNLSSVAYQVDIINSRKSMLLWYTGDEPDGQVDPLNATKITYDLIKSVDPWHPVSLCLNCYNYYYEEYSSGADIILEDVYPIAVNTSYSVQYDTVCNTTYGCCGCDDCDGNFEDISTRLDLFASYQDWIGGSPKPFWGVPQAFGNETFWSRYPTQDEEVVMNMLSINHDAKGIVMWDWPTEPDLASVTSDLAKTLVAANVTKFLLGSHTTGLGVHGQKRIDAAAWTVGKQMLVSIVNLEYSDSSAEISITLPATASSIETVAWGPGGWTVGNNGTIAKEGIQGLEVDLILLKLK